MRLTRTLVMLAVVALGAVAHAQTYPLFANPFEPAAEILARRSPAPASERLVYEQVRDNKKEMITFLLAPDWSAVISSSGTEVRDYAANRVYQIGVGRKTYQNLNGAYFTAFRVMEIQNREYLSGILKAGGVPNAVMNMCEAESELGIALPGSSDSGIKISRKQATISARCGDSLVAEVVVSDGDKATPQFWAALGNIVGIHPRVMSELLRGPPPQTVRVERTFGDNRTVISLRLAERARVATPFPLTASMKPVGTLELDRDKLAEVARAALAGAASGGPPTIDAWKKLSVSNRKEFGLSSLSIISSFPDAMKEKCPPATRCAHFDVLGDLLQSDPAVRALYTLATAEQSGDRAKALDAMKSAQATPQRNHPAIAASWALALENVDGLADDAKQNGLPTDTDELRRRALVAYPYSVGYWSDYGKRFVAGFDYANALMAFDIAASLPVPGAKSSLARQPEEFLRRIREDFPVYFPK